jgi:hypothetical protein
LRANCLTASGDRQEILAMPRLCWIPLTFMLLLFARPCAADDRSPDTERSVALGASTSFTGTPEMWFYEQERIRYEDPKKAVRRRAELRAAQRADRLAALKWYGHSNSRPTVNSTPTMSSYAPYWGSNTYDPNRWRAWTPSVVIRPLDTRYY